MPDGSWTEMSPVGAGRARGEEEGVEERRRSRSDEAAEVRVTARKRVTRKKKERRIGRDNGQRKTRERGYS
jgi:hypothetical protein